MRTKEGNKEQAILDASITLFASVGYHNTKISDIAEKAGIATGSVYLYYPNKESILFKIFENIWQQISIELTQVQQNIKMSPLEKLESIIDLVFSVFKLNPALGSIFVNEQQWLSVKNDDKFSGFYNKFMDMGGEYLKEGQDLGLFNPELSPEIFKYFVFGAIRFLIHKWAENPENYNIDNLKSTVRMLVKNGIY